MPVTELLAQYHRVRLEEPIGGVRLARVAGEVPGGLDVPVFREPLTAGLAFACWKGLLLAMTVIDAQWSFRGALALAASIPVVVSALTWRYVTPGAALEGAVRAVLSGPSSALSWAAASPASLGWRCDVSARVG